MTLKVDREEFIKILMDKDKVCSWDKHGALDVYDDLENRGLFVVSRKKVTEWLQREKEDLKQRDDAIGKTICKTLILTLKELLEK